MNVSNNTENNFKWTTFYSEFADKLLLYKNNRTKLRVILEDSFNSLKLRYPFIDNNEPIDDICPFTVFGCFNKGITDANRILIMRTIGDKLGVQAEIPLRFDGIPVLNNMRAWFFGNKLERKPDDISNLWDVFETGITYADNPLEITKGAFTASYDRVRNQLCIKWNITMGLYWIRPYAYLNLDERNRNYLIHGNNQNLIDIANISNLKQLPSAKTYLELITICKKSFNKADNPFHSFPELSYMAWEYGTSDNNKKVSNADFLKWFTPIINALRKLGGSATPEQVRNQIIADLKLSEDVINETRGKTATKKFNNDVAFARNYLVYDGYIDKSVRGVWTLTKKGLTAPMNDELASDLFIKWANAFKEDLDNNKLDDEDDEIDLSQTDNYYTETDFLSEVFMDADCYDKLVHLLKNKKNIILQGAPGVGKTFAAKRLAYSIMGKIDSIRVMMVQFHQSYSYEDFIMGFRPTKEGFELAEGPFYQFCKMAQDDDKHEYFFIIDEINRGNMSKIFGELLMLIESDKRGESLHLLYSKELFSVPKNVYIIGMMNTADRSLAMIDYALRRRFAFFEIEPAFDSDGFQAIMKHSVNHKLRALVELIKDLNVVISKDETLGNGFKIGHSYFCSNNDINVEWLSAVVNFELIPLLNEYWFDEQSKFEQWSKKLRDVLYD